MRDFTQDVLNIFKEISQVPRKSKHEQQIADFLEAWGKRQGLAVDRDEANNIVMHVPATPGYETAPIIAIQNHMDMVCEKTPESTHDFSRDPIELVIRDEWLFAKDTTLGADNGLGLAIAMAFAIDKDLPHPQLEIVVTSDEETGMTGAMALKPGQLKAKVLLNLDSEDEGIFTVGCAGGRETRSELKLEPASVPAGFVQLGMVVSGLTGGHSGVDVHRGRATANKLMVRLLNRVLQAAPEALLIDLAGGSAHNAISRDAFCKLALTSEHAESLKGELQGFEGIFRSEYKNVDSEISLKFELGAAPSQAYSSASTRRVADLLYAYPHGVAAYSQDIDGLVESSCNFAKISIKDGLLRILSSQRSSVASKLDMLTERIESCLRLAGGVAKSNEGYPAWEPDMDSDVLKRAVACFEARFNRSPIIEVIHAGLECGIIGAKHPGMEMLSFGPTIYGAHSPTERAKITTIQAIVELLADILASYRTA